MSSTALSLLPSFPGAPRYVVVDEIVLRDHQIALAELRRIAIRWVEVLAIQTTLVVPA